MGYRGDNKVTRLIVQLWKQSSVFTANYDAAMVFFHELSKTRVTLDMSSDDANFYIDIPESITIQNGNYQLYFV
jgi:hypothetical protein